MDAESCCALQIRRRTSEARLPVPFRPVGAGAEGETSSGFLEEPARLTWRSRRGTAAPLG